MAGASKRLAAAILVVATVGPGTASAASGLGGAEVNAYYGPVCKKQFGSTNCGISPAAGVRFAVLTYPGLKPLGSATANSIGVARFERTLPFSLAFAFSGRSHGHAYLGSWRLNNLQSLSGQTLPLDLLLCPSGAWVLSLGSVVDSCSPHANGAIAYGAPRGSA